MGGQASAEFGAGLGAFRRSGRCEWSQLLRERLTRVDSVALGPFTAGRDAAEEGVRWFCGDADAPRLAAWAWGAAGPGEVSESCIHLHWRFPFRCMNYDAFVQHGLGLGTHSAFLVSTRRAKPHFLGKVGFRAGVSMNSVFSSSADRQRAPKSPGNPNL